MIEIDTNKIQLCDYTIIVPGNGCEEQLIISSSTGQGGKGPLIIVAMSCDGGGQVIFSERVYNRDVEKIVEDQVTRWATGISAYSIKPNAAQLATIMATAKKISKMWDEDFFARNPQLQRAG